MSDPSASRLSRAQQASAEQQLSTYLFKTGLSFAKRHYLLTCSYILGLLVLQFAQGFAVTPALRDAYDGAMQQTDIPRLHEAMEELAVRQQTYYDSKGWFFSCDDTCQEAKASLALAQQELDAAEAHNARVLSTARARVGVFSQYGVQDARDKFWGAFEAGRGFAKRASMYDALFLSINAMRRDDSLLSVVLNWLFQMALNFTLGMIGALIGFASQLYFLLSSYQAGWGEALAFFGLAMAAACSVLASFIVGLYLTAATGAYVAVKASGGRVRITAGGTAHRMIHVE
jgi:hypothetical protein